MPKGESMSKKYWDKKDINAKGRASNPKVECPKCIDCWKPGRINIGIHNISEVDFYDRFISHLPKATFASIIRKIEKDLDKEHA